jgi:aryl-alcohol dehydrogenase-like predicted oxidoreductase
VLCRPQPVIHAALDAGINFIDTADVYSQGESEEIVGKALAGGKRDEVVLATKVGFPMGDDLSRRGASRRRIIRGVEDSLRRLNTDWIDLYQIHRPDPNTDIDETLSALSDLVHQGKIRYFGHSTFPASEIVEAQWTSERRPGKPAEARRRGAARPARQGDRHHLDRDGARVRPAAPGRNRGDHRPTDDGAPQIAGCG